MKEWVEKAITYLKKGNNTDLKILNLEKRIKASFNERTADEDKRLARIMKIDNDER